ncbi:MAG: Hsp20/alpha crystallin family protein [bacterium]|nr:Hsp20/alpha crystallin family protein [bacterium]
MPRDSRSFFEKLTGSVPADEYYEEDTTEEEGPVTNEPPQAHLAMATATKSKVRQIRKVTPVKQEGREDEAWLTEEEGQLTVDVFQKEGNIIIQSTVAGVRPDDLDVQITRDMVTIRGKREQARETSGDDYYYQELYWGSFSRSILLPHEVDVDGSNATLKNGLLTITLPQLDKNRTERLRVKHD